MVNEKDQGDHRVSTMATLLVDDGSLICSSTMINRLKAADRLRVPGSDYSPEEPDAVIISLFCFYCRAVVDYFPLSATIPSCDTRRQVLLSMTYKCDKDDKCLLATSDTGSAQVRFTNFARKRFLNSFYDSDDIASYISPD